MTHKHSPVLLDGVPLCVETSPMRSGKTMFFFECEVCHTIYGREGKYQ